MKKFLTILPAFCVMAVAVLFAACGQVPKVSGLELDIVNAKTAYTIGEEFSSAGLVVKKVFDNDSKETLSATEYDVNWTAFNKNVAGSYVIFVTFGDFSEPYRVTVSEPQVKRIEIDTTNAKTAYVVGEDFSSEGLVVKKVYNNNTKETLARDDFVVDSSNFKKTEIGEYAIDVFYDDFSLKYQVEVLPELTFEDLKAKAIAGAEEFGMTNFLATEIEKDAEDNIVQTSTMYVAKETVYGLLQRDEGNWLLMYVDKEGDKYYAYKINRSSNPVENYNRKGEYDTLDEAYSALNGYISTGMPAEAADIYIDTISSLLNMPEDKATISYSKDYITISVTYVALVQGDTALLTKTMIDEYNFDRENYLLVSASYGDLGTQEFKYNTDYEIPALPEIADEDWEEFPAIE